MRASAVSLLAAAGLASAILSPDPLAAQGFGAAPTGQPRQLFPQPEPGAGEWPETAPGFREPSAAEDSPSRQPAPLWGDADRQPAPAEGEGPVSLRGGIVVDRLGTGLPETSGPLDPGAGGLGLDLWAGSDRNQVVRLLDAAPRQIESPALRDLTVRLLLSAASPPSGGGRAGQPGELLLARAELLKHIGAYEGLLELLERLPRDAASDPALAKLHVEAALLTRNRAAACRQARAGVNLFPETAFWQEVLIYCQITEGEEAAANLGLSLLREAGDGNPEIISLAEAALGLAEPPEPQQVDALVLAYLAALETPPPASIVERAPPELLGALAQQPRLEPELRLQLREQAVEKGALPAESLAEAYKRQRFSASEMDDAAQAAGRLGGARGRALLYQGASRSHLATERGSLLGRFVEEASVEGLDLAALTLAGLLVEDLQPGVEAVELAPLAARSLIVTGRMERAAAWVSLLRSQSARGAEAQTGYSAVWPLARVAGIENDAVLDVQAWAGRRAAGGDPAQVEQEAALLRNLIEALGGEPAGQPSPLLSRVGGTAPPSPSALYALHSAAAEGRRGETVLYALQLVGEGPPGHVHPQALAEVVGALSAVGLAREARAIAVESLVVQGF